MGHAANRRLNGNLGPTRVQLIASQRLRGQTGHSAGRTRHPLHYGDRCETKVWRMTRVEGRAEGGCDCEIRQGRKGRGGVRREGGLMKEL